MSATRKRYIVRLMARCVVLLLCFGLCLWHPESFGVLDGTKFFSEFSFLHLLWLIWVLDMIQQIVPIKNKVPLGSQKLFANRFRPIREKINYDALKAYIISTTKAAYEVFVLWCLLIAAIGGGVIPQVCAGMERVDFLSGLLTGMGSGIGGACLALWAVLGSQLRDEQALKQARLEELDERNQLIQKTACTATLLMGMAVLVVAAVVTAFLNMTVFETLYACLMGMVLLYVVTVLVCRRLM